MATHENPRRHLILLIALLLIIVLSPFIVTLRHGVTVLNIVGAAVLLSATYAVSERKNFLAIAIILSAISIITTWLLAAFPAYWLVVVSHGSLVVLIGFFSFTILGYVVRSGKITSDRIYGAICVYLLFGYAWTFAYALLDELQPGSFAASNEIGSMDYVGRVMQLRYFSFMTLTTVGYGDIVPRSPAARTMAMLEAVMGQFYLVALIGRLVGLHIVHTTSSRALEE
jgi:voltage-gated potassium channel